MTVSQQSDSALLQACSNGNISAYEEIFLRYSDRMYKFALKYTRDPNVAEEIMMDVMLWIWENRERLAGVSNLPSYLFAATRNKVFNQLRKKALETFSLEDVAGEGHLKDFSANSSMEFEELYRHYEKSLERLSPQCKAVFTLSRQEELSYPEISKKLNISVKTVEGHITSALKSLRKSMVQYPDSVTLMILSLFF